MKMKRGTLVLVFGCVLAAPIVATASGVTYDFVGTVYNTSGAYSSIALGTPIIGTYTFDYSLTDPAEYAGVGPRGSTQGDWYAQLAGGGGSVFPVPSGYVFTSTATVGSLSYATAPAAGYDTQSYISGINNGAEFEASELHWDTSSTYTTSTVDLVDMNNNGMVKPVFTSDGLPLIANSTLSYGSFVSGTNLDDPADVDAVRYTITSLTPAPVPLPAGAWLLFSGLIGLGRMARGRPAPVRD